MKNTVEKLFGELESARDSMRSCYPAFDEQILFALKRNHLDFFRDVEIKKEASENLELFFGENVRLAKIDEISYDSNEKIHLPGVESVLSSMRGMGYSLVFVLQGNVTETYVYFGISKFEKEAPDISTVMKSYVNAWEANFPGSSLQNTFTIDEPIDVSQKIGEYRKIGALTGIPSLKREEDTELFVQGLERFIRAMRGKQYTWISIADPIPQNYLQETISICQDLQSEVHQFVKSQLGKSDSRANTLMLGMFGMKGWGETDSTAKAVSEVKTTGLSQATTNGFGFIFNHSTTKTVMESVARGITNTVSHAVAKQMGLGGFGSLGRTWTKTTDIRQEILNRKAEYVEEMLQNYEERLQQGTALGMWNLGNYFCAMDPDIYTIGCGVISSLFSGMDSTYEPPRTIELPEKFKTILRKFQNIYINFENKYKDGTSDFTHHPLGSAFNGPATPVNTKELAIALPLSTQDVEGITVTRRPSFGVNLPKEIENSASLTVGTILDKGNETRQKYQLALSNLPKHLSVFGLTGSGKTNTIHHLLSQLWKVHHIPFLVIEPAKAEYRALAQMPELKDELLVISAGIDQTSACPLRLNPFNFNPGADNDANRVHVLTHIDRLKATFNASFPMYASMPYILEEAILEVYRDRGWDLGRSLNRYVDIYSEDFSAYIPTLKDLSLKVEKIVKQKRYFQEQEMNIQAALKARLSSLMVGAKGTMFNCEKSISAKDLFSRPVIIELENMGDDDEKAFLMGLIVSNLYEFRKATFKAAGTGENPELFKHVLVIEEAHRLLANIPESSENMEIANVKGKSVAAFVDMLSEIRAMGQSVFVVDQLPSRVSPNIVKGTGSKIVHRLLAKDDREAVGWTMGMDEKQIDDLSLLRTGECIISQDGDRKSFMCRVPKNELHERREGGEFSPFTDLYKKEHSDLFALESDFIDMEDIFFKEDLENSMVAIGLGMEPNRILKQVLPTRSDTSEEARKSMLLIYWKDIMRIVWNDYQGNYKKYVALCKAGMDVLNGTDTTAETYRTAFQNYYQDTRKYLYEYMQKDSVQRLQSTALESLLLRHGVLKTINEKVDARKNIALKNPKEYLESLIKATLPLIVPRGLRGDMSYNKKIFDEILSRIPLSFNKEGVE